MGRRLVWTGEHPFKHMENFRMDTTTTYWDMGAQKAAAASWTHILLHSLTLVSVHGLIFHLFAQENWLLQKVQSHCWVQRYKAHRLGAQFTQMTLFLFRLYYQKNYHQQQNIRILCVDPPFVTSSKSWNKTWKNSFGHSLQGWQVSGYLQDTVLCLGQLCP